jgi:hypothetical protein
MAAISRIERALARLDAAASRPAKPAPSPAPDEDAQRLAAAHAALRGKVEAAIGRIDGLIAGAEGG